MYAIADLSDYANCSLHSQAKSEIFSHILRPHWTRNVRLETAGFRFPLAKRFHDHNLTLEGVEHVTWIVEIWFVESQ